MTRKKKYKNGLSITPFIVNKDAGDVEKGVDNFNSMMSTGNPTNGGMCESKTGDIVTDVREAGGKDRYIAKQELLLKNRKNKLGKTIDPAEKQKLKDEIDLIQAKINFVLSKPQQPKLSDEEIRRKRQELYKLKRQLLTDPPNQPYNWKPYAERRIAKLRQELEDNGINEYLKENKMKFKHLHEDIDNVSEVEAKSREVVDPAFASAVRSIRSHDKQRAEARKIRKAPKQGEESLPKDLKMTLDESLFEDVKESLQESKDYLGVSEIPDSNWVKWEYHDNGKVYKGDAKVFDEPSDYGINNGRVSKFYAQANGIGVANYDRGWDENPSKEHKATIDKIIKKLDKYAKNRGSKKVESIERPLKESAGDEDVQVYMNTWANYNEYGADLSKYGINSIKDGWMSIDEAREFAEKYAEDEPFINDIETPLGSLGINEYSNVEESLDLLEKISEYDKYDLEVIGAIYEDQGGELKDSIEIFDSGDYEYYSGVNSLTDLAYELIAQIGGIKDAVSNPENYIDEEALRRDLSFDIRELMRDSAEEEIDEKHKYDDEEDFDREQEIEDWMDEHEDDYLDMYVDEILNDIDGKTIENYFDYDAFGRDLGYDGYYITDKGAIRIL